MKQKIYEVLRMHVAKRATHNLGKIEITDDEVICYVDGKKIKKQMKEIGTLLNRYRLMFHSIPTNEEIYKTYKLDKPVHYIIKNVDFDKEISISAAMKDCHVTFENCSFTTCIEINFADHLTFINNTYKAQESILFSFYESGEFCISTYDRINEVNKLELINNKIYVPDIKEISGVNMNDKENVITPITKSKLQLWLYAKEVILNASDIIDAKKLEIGAETLHLEDEYLISDEIEIKADKIILDNATIRANVITIDSPLIEGKLPIYHEGLFINGVEVDKNEGLIDNYDLELQQKRLELINSLKKIERTCEEKISEEIRKQPLTRVLKNKKKKK